MKVVGIEALKYFQQAAMEAKYKKMPNGEERYSLMLPWGGFTVTIAGPQGGWQDAHSHPQPEQYEVVQGHMALALLMEDHDPLQAPMNDLFLYSAGQSVTVSPRRPHNVFLASGTIIHTTSVRGSEPAVWTPEPDLDEWSKKFDTMQKILLYTHVRFA